MGLTTQRRLPLPHIAAMDRGFVRDRYARAVTSSDLAPAGVDLDVLGAAGMAAQRCELGMLLQRLRADPGMSLVAAKVAQEALSVRLRRAVQRREVRRAGQDAADVAEAALAWWLDGRCLSCHGVKFQAANGRLLGKACPACDGSGLRPVPAGDAGRWLVDYISQQVARSEGAHRVALG